MTDKQKTRASTYRVNSPLIVVGQYIPAGVVADLSDVSDAMLSWLLERKMIEAASLKESEQPFNSPIGTADASPCSGCK